MPRIKEPDPEKYCQHCGKRLERKRYNGTLESLNVFVRRKYCDQICMAQHMVRERVTLAGYRWRAEQMRDATCAHCGTSENLHAHHLDEDPSNNSPENILTLCGSCHQKWHWDHGRTLPHKASACRICGKPARKLGMCQKHYQRFKKYGDPYLTKKRSGSGFVLERETPGAQNGQR